MTFTPRTPQEDPQRRRWHRLANLPVKHTDVRLADLGAVPPAVANFVRDYKAGENTGVGLALTGKPGRGKTTLACAILNELVWEAPKATLGHHPEAAFSMNRPLVFTEFASYLADKKRLFKMEAQGLMDTPDYSKIDTLCEGIEAACPNDTWNCRVAVLDDLGKEHSTRTRWAEDSYDEILRRRFNRGYATIVTSNSPVEKWGDIYSESMADFAREAFVEVAVSRKDGSRR